MRLAGDIAVLWGKARPSSSEGPRFHPLACHLLDVALVTRAMWRTVLSSATRRRIASAFGISEDAAEGWLSLWAGLHDLGKASPVFQRLDSDGWERVGQAGFPRPQESGRTPHGVITAATLSELLSAPPWQLDRRLALGVATAVGGHHGVLPSTRLIADVRWTDRGAGPWERARRELLALLASCLGLVSHERPGRLDNATAMFLAGLVSVADWIGSNVVFFPYAGLDTDGQLDLAAYQAQAEAAAVRALRCLGWLGWRPAPAPRRFTELFPFIPSPNDLQQNVVALAERLVGPALVVVEAPMGEGKTEAAMYLVDRWSVDAGSRGAYFALPTQATSNQMFSRVRRFLEASLPGQMVNLQLLHGQAALSAELELLRREGSARYQLADVGRDEVTTGPPSGVVAAEWFTYRKRGLLAPFGVGTVDQALLAVLKTRHVFVRLFGLTHKTVVVDEVHAYDAYMSALLERLLEWLAALGASVVLLSATLPAARRQALVAAYARGLGRAAPSSTANSAPYPRLTWLTAAGEGARAVRVSELARKTVHLAWLHPAVLVAEGGRCELGARLEAALKQGGCALVVCNTVARAQVVYAALSGHFSCLAEDGEPELTLLHGRFPFEAREAREQLVLRRFGKPGGWVAVGPDREEPVCRPRRAVVVATQVVEQSLDLDFDLLVSELAPADLLLQRSGRLHRHARARPPGLSMPSLWVIGPADEAGLPRFDPGSLEVYAAHVLLRSWLALRSRDRVAIPDDVAELIEAVYDERPCPPELPGELRHFWEETRRELDGALTEARQQAADRWLKPVGFAGALWRLTESPGEEDAPELHPAHQALTRLAEPSVQVVCLYDQAGRASLDPEGREPVDLDAVPTVETARRLLRRAATLADRRVVFPLLAAEPPPAWQRSPLLRRHRPLLFDRQGRAVVGRAVVLLDDHLGLVVKRAEEVAM